MPLHKKLKISLPDGATAQLGLGLTTDVQFSPDGKYLAVATSIGIELRRSDTLELTRFLTNHTGVVLSVAFSPDGRTLASGSWNKAIKLWDVATGTLQCTFTSHTRPVYSVAFSPDGRTLVSGSKDDTIKLWNVATGTLQRTFTGRRNSV
ncbi:MAG TPA: hypothetical protein ENH11_03900, partial [Candidatus Acetothermia bacterium]|nr:hypothetical protein [Candidatus Acetothermia bacterium]